MEINRKSLLFDLFNLKKKKNHIVWRFCYGGKGERPAKATGVCDVRENWKMSLRGDSLLWFCVFRGPCRGGPHVATNTTTPPTLDMSPSLQYNPSYIPFLSILVSRYYLFNHIKHLKFFPHNPPSHRPHPTLSRT